MINRATEKTWQAHTTTHDWYKCEWGSNEVVKQTQSYSVIAPGQTPEQTILVCEINDTDRNPWTYPHDGLLCARLIAAAPELLAACEALPLDCEFEDAADFKDNSEKFLRAIRLAKAAVAKARGN